MIVKFKIFEEINNNTPKIGDYAIINLTYNNLESHDHTNFINSSIGYIWKNPSENIYLIKYDNIPDNIEKNFHFSDYSNGLKHGNSILTDINNIKYWSDDREELIPLLKSDKYNL